jgi:hypothetical protein
VRSRQRGIQVRSDGTLKEIIDVKPGRFGSSNDVDFSPDNRFMCINDHGNSVLWIYEMASRTIVASFGRAGHAPGEWTSFHSLADPMGNIYPTKSRAGASRNSSRRYGAAGSPDPLPQPSSLRRRPSWFHG